MDSKSMDRRLFVTTLLGAAGVAALTVVLSPSSEAVAKVLLDDSPKPNILPDLEDLQAEPDEPGGGLAEDEEQLAYHMGHKHRRRRVRRWRRVCRREWWQGHYRRRCRKHPFWVWLSIG